MMDMRAAKDRLIDRAIADVERTRKRGQWKAEAGHLARLGRLLEPDQTPMKTGAARAWEIYYKTRERLA